MRILLTSLPAAGHLRPLVPIAHAALRAGHEVVVCTPESAKDQVEAYGLRHVPAGVDWLGQELGTLARLGMSGSAEAKEDLRARLNTDLYTEGLAGAATLAMATDVIAAADGYPPDLVVRENTEFGGYLAAEALGLPHVSVGVGGGKADQLVTRLAPALDVLRGSLGLPPDPTGARATACLHVSLVPPAYQPARVPHARHYRQTNPRQPDDALPGWLATEPPGRPLVLAAFGTLLPLLGAFGDTLRAIVAGLGGLDCTAVVAANTATVQDPGSVPANVRLVERVPQPLVLECCDLFVTHGGFNSIREALRLGVPMVVVPWLTDSHGNATRCADLGIAEVVPAAGITAAALRQACAAVLADGGYRRRARAMQRHVLALPGMDVLVKDLEAAVRG
jgi:N-glycosyltransferase